MICWICLKPMKVVADKAGHKWLACECGATSNIGDKQFVPKLTKKGK